MPSFRTNKQLSCQTLMKIQNEVFGKILGKAHSLAKDIEGAIGKQDFCAAILE